MTCFLLLDTAGLSPATAIQWQKASHRICEEGLQMVIAKNATCWCPRLRGNLVGMDKIESDRNDIPKNLVDGMFELAANMPDDIGRRPYTTSGGRPSPAKIREIFGISDSKMSLWRTQKLDRDGPEAPLKFTEKLIEIF